MIGISEYTNVLIMRKNSNQTLLFALEAKAEEASRLLMSMGNTKRLLVLCNLVDGKKSVGQLAEIVGLSQPALSQHLGKMRNLGLISPRRDGQTIYYQLASREARSVLKTLYRLYCTPA